MSLIRNEFEDCLGDPSLDSRIIFRIYQAGNLLDRQTMKILGISTIQWSVLEVLSRPDNQQGLTIAELCDYLIVSRQNLDNVLKRLEQRGYITRMQGEPDRRERYVVLSANGKEYIETLKPKKEEFHRNAFSRLGLDDKASFVHFLNKFNIEIT